MRALATSQPIGDADLLTLNGAVLSHHQDRHRVAFRCGRERSPHLEPASEFVKGANVGSTPNITSRQRSLEKTDDPGRPRGWLVLSVILAAAVVLAFDVWTSPGIAAAVPYVVVVLLALNSRNARFVLVVASACTCLTVAGFYASSASDRFEFGGAVANRLLALLAIWITAIVGFQRRRADERRREHARRREMILHSALDAVVSMDEEGRIIAWNPQAELTFGWTDQEAQGKDLAELIIPPHFREPHRNGLKHFLATGIGPVLNQRLELAAVRRGGEEFPVELTVLPHRVGERYQFSAFVRDLTDRRRADQSTALLSALVGSSDDAMISLDLEGIVSSWNRGAEVMYGYTEAEMIGASITRIWPPEAEDESHMVLRRAAQGEPSRNQEVVRLAKNGRTVDVALTVSPIRNAAGEVVGISTIGRDISDSKRHEESLQLWAAELRETTSESLQRKQEAEEANRAKSQFLANMSHELRTPLNAIIGYSEMLQEDALQLGQEIMATDLEKICGAGRHLLKLINDVLDLSKVEAGKLDAYVEQFEVMPFVDEVASTVRPLVEQRGNQLTVRCDPEIGPMHSDRTKVRQCLFNLLSNSAKFTDCGTVSLVVSQHVEDDRNWITFEVADTGIGISKDQLGKVFEAFVQAENSTTRKYGGTGLGLTLTKRFCELLGGKLQAESEPGKGSRFTLLLPAHIDTPQSEPEVVVPRNRMNVAVADRPIESGTDTVLVVDDDPAMLDLFGRFLEGEGFLVATASTGQEGLARAKALHPAAVVLDVMLPIMDGWDVLRAMKKDTAIADIPVVMVSTLDNHEMGYALGVSDYLTKPIDRHQLLSILDKYRTSVLGTILVVDDDPDVVKFLMEQVRDPGWEIIGVNNGREALRWLGTHRPSLILLDLFMPEMNGFAFLSELQRREELDFIPIIVLTAKDVTAEERRRLDGSVERILRKGTFDQSELLQALRRYLRRTVPAEGTS
jgi:PAS domain S-box-containing protein